MRRAALLFVVTLAAGTVVAGCSSSPGAITTAGERALAPKVQAVRVAAVHGSYATLRERVASLDAAVRQQEAAGAVTSDRAAAILDAADALLNDASPAPSPTTPTTAPATTAPPTTPPPTTPPPTTPPPTTAPPTTAPPTTAPPTTAIGITTSPNGGGHGHSAHGSASPVVSVSAR